MGIGVCQVDEFGFLGGRNVSKDGRALAYLGSSQEPHHHSTGTGTVEETSSRGRHKQMSMLNREH